MLGAYSRGLRLRKGGRPWIELSGWYWFLLPLWELVGLLWSWIKRPEPGVRVTLHPSGEQLVARRLRDRPGADVAVPVILS